MPEFATTRLPVERSDVAPDGSDVRLLLRLAGGSMAHFSLPPNAVSRAVVHRTVEEIWYVLAGGGRMWRRQGETEAMVELQPGMCLTIPRGTLFQFRAAAEGLQVVAATLPPWPGDDEAVAMQGPWPPTAP
jgi:mannose-6-phosphate isomerase-like protein (cupin superfamily)